jgi:formyltetrahydrofolate-dependent phosphoribosylglycinamide formyltransferase
MNRARLAVFISGSGSNLQAIIDAAASGTLSAEVAFVVASNHTAYGMERARMAGIETMCLFPTTGEANEAYGTRVLNELTTRAIDFIALAGYLKLLPGAVVRAFENKIVNIHPALLPKYGGKGMYGHHVHEAVLASGDKESGLTIHLVNEKYDEGHILEQIRVPVMPDDTPDTLAARILIQEHMNYPRVIENLIRGAYDIR